MFHLNDELFLLSRAICYQNLSGAAQHLGVSQPQLSRIVQKLEQSFDIILLDRTAKRKSVWTGSAAKLVELYQRMTHEFDHGLQSLNENFEPQWVKVQCLEGLSLVGLEFCHHILRQSKTKGVELNIFDLNEIEENIFANRYEFSLTCREPGMKKFKYIHRLGFQILETDGEESDTLICSTFEYEQLARNMEKVSQNKKFFVSNSLKIRMSFSRKYGGKISVPSLVQKKNHSENSADVPVLILGNEFLSHKFWEKCTKLNFAE